jgi:predicted permease
MSEMSHHLTYSLRSLRKSPGFTAAAVLTLALGIGANSAIFSVVNGVLLRPLPYRDPARLVVVRLDLGSIRDVSSFSVPERDDLEREASLLEGVTSFTTFSGQLLAIGDSTEPVNTGAVWYNFFSLLGVTPMMGRDFLKTENNHPAASNMMILSYAFWKDRFGADPNVLGKTVLFGGLQTRIVGVLPPRFQCPDIQGMRGVSMIQPEVWVPMNFNTPPPRSGHFLRAIARLRKGATLASAQGQLDTISAALAQQYSEYKPGGIRFRIHQMQSDIVGATRPAILLLAWAVGFVLLIVCSNVATLLIARWKTREREIAIRAALGAGAGTIMRQVLTESLLLALASGSLGVTLAYGGVNLLQRLKPENLPRLSDIHVDLNVLAVSAGVSLLSSLLFGILPAIQTSRLKITDTLRSGGRSSGGLSRSRMMGTLVTSEVALCMILLIASGLLIQTFVRLQRVDPGFDSSHTLTLRSFLQFEQGQTPQFRNNFYDQLQRRIAGLPSVRSVGVTSILPFSPRFNTGPYAFSAETVSHFGDLNADYRVITPGYFETLRTPLLAGRFFDDHDGVDGKTPVIVDDLIASTAWPAVDPIGQKFWIEPGTPNPQPFLCEIVGVVRHLRMHQLNTMGAPQVFIPVPVASRAFLGGVNDFVIRLDGDPMRIIPAIRETTKQLNPHSAATNFETLQEALDRATAGTQFVLILMSVFAGIAMVLALCGLYGVISYTVSDRWREMGIRIALGARPTDVLGLVLQHGMMMSLAGVAIGLVGAFGLTPLLRSMLYGVRSSDPATYVTVAGLLAAISALACYLPARRATLADPIEAMRSE